jgi:hypothetical protein
MARRDPWHPTPATLLGDCRDWCIRMKRSLCVRAGTYRLADLGGVCGKQHTAARIVARLQCQHSHRPPTDVRLISTLDPNAPAKAIRMPMEWRGNIMDDVYLPDDRMSLSSVECRFGSVGPICAGREGCKADARLFA